MLCRSGYRIYYRGSFDTNYQKFRTGYRVNVFPTSCESNTPPLTVYATLYIYLSPEGKSSEALILIHNILIHNIYLVKDVSEVGRVNFRPQKILPGNRILNEWCPSPTAAHANGQTVMLGSMKETYPRTLLQKILRKKKPLSEDKQRAQRHSQIYRLSQLGHSAIVAGQDKGRQVQGVVDVNFPPVKLDLGDAVGKVSQ
ncbi:hypothetical protein BDP27DRAFT_266369 [Rhodocollybia butyracea]|uniref:Uncharacterized protein n=1 Tax=Rhodocollybia butyracea TaxID=206335 RepID=A0A9P5Q580_9AGAR|nr:hypothetical protein BDP27DRAFT_266369 [Rhodocollybia butyracea]